jgi:hypothetical protein
MTFLLALAVSALPASATEPADDTVVQADGTVLHGRVLSCGDGVRFVPAGSAEVLLQADVVREVRLASGAPCPLVRPERSLAGGIFAVLVFPVLGALVGGVIGDATCHGDDHTPCAYGGALAGAAVGVILGSTILISAAVQSSDPAPVAATRREKRPVGLSLAVRF